MRKKTLILTNITNSLTVVMIWVPAGVITQDPTTLEFLLKYMALKTELRSDRRWWSQFSRVFLVDMRVIQAPYVL